MLERKSRRKGLLWRNMVFVWVNFSLLQFQTSLKQISKKNQIQIKPEAVQSWWSGNLTKPTARPTKDDLGAAPRAYSSRGEGGLKEVGGKEKELRRSSSHCAFAAAHELQPFPFPVTQIMSIFIPYLWNTNIQPLAIVSLPTLLIPMFRNKCRILAEYF